METVLVTGASGYIAQHCLLQLLQQGYRVRGTIRNPAREVALRQALRQHLQADDRLEFVVADLEVDSAWAEAMRGCTYVLHTASPIPEAEPADENVLIKPAVEGTQRVLNAAVQAGVRRLVLTSSVAAIVGGHPPGTTFTEADWSDTNAIQAYQKSKTLAERTAWDFVRTFPTLELATINPVYVIGPSLDGHYSISADIIGSLMKRKYPGLARLGFSMVDVRDVAAAHLAAMTTPEAAGKRFICYTEFLWFREIAEILNQQFADQGYRIPMLPIPDIALRFIGLFDGTVRMLLGQLGRKETYSTEQIRQVLKWSPRPIKTSIIETAQNMIDLGVV